MKRKKSFNFCDYIIKIQTPLKTNAVLKASFKPTQKTNPNPHIIAETTLEPKISNFILNDLKNNFQTPNCHLLLHQKTLQKTIIPTKRYIASHHLEFSQLTPE